MNPTRRVPVVWITALFLLAAGITIAAFCSLIIPEYRHLTFYQVMASSCVAELVFFGYLGYLLSGTAKGPDPGHSVRLRTMALIAFWALAIIISGAVAVSTKYADTLFSDKILIWQLIASFFVLSGAYFFHRQQVVIEDKRAEPERQRAQVQSYALGVDRLLGSLRSLPGKFPESAVQLEQLTKRLETLKSQLRGNIPVAERRAGRLVEPESADQVEQSLRKVHEQVQRLTTTTPENLRAELESARQVVDDALATLRHRHGALST